MAPKTARKGLRSLVGGGSISCSASSNRVRVGLLLVLQVRLGSLLWGGEAAEVVVVAG